MSFDSKHEFAPPTILLGLLLCPWAWGITSQLLQCHAAAAPASTILLGFLWPWTWVISSRPLQRSTATAADLEHRVSPSRPLQCHTDLCSNSYVSNSPSVEYNICILYYCKVHSLYTDRFANDASNSSEKGFLLCNADFSSQTYLLIFTKFQLITKTDWQSDSEIHLKEGVYEDSSIIFENKQYKDSIS